MRKEKNFYFFCIISSIHYLFARDMVTGKASQISGTTAFCYLYGTITVAMICSYCPRIRVAGNGNSLNAYYVPPYLGI